MIALGTTFGPTTIPITREMLVRYADASGDHNPIHLDADFAQRVGLPDIIAHGMLTMGLAASTLQTWLGSCAAVTEFGTRFVKPVIVPVDGTTISFTGNVVEELGDGLFLLEVSATSAGVKVLGMCRATVTV
jgi:acyl dehydratase